MVYDAWYLDSARIREEGHVFEFDNETFSAEVVFFHSLNQGPSYWQILIDIKGSMVNG